MESSIKSYEYTGILRDVRRCYIDDSGISFLFGYVLEHKNPSFIKDDWFASSYITQSRCKAGQYLFNTANSIYLTSDYRSLIVPDSAVTNIRLGTPPEVMLSATSGNDIFSLMTLVNKIQTLAQENECSTSQIIEVLVKNSGKSV